MSARTMLGPLRRREGLPLPGAPTQLLVHLGLGDGSLMDVPIVWDDPGWNDVHSVRVKIGEQTLYDLLDLNGDVPESVDFLKR